MSTPRPSEADVEALTEVLTEWLDERPGDTPHETARRILAARDAEHEREVAALREDLAALRIDLTTSERIASRIEDRAEAAERALADRGAAIKALRAGIWALGESIHGDEGVEHVGGCEGEPTCFACILADLRALLPRDDAAGAGGAG